MSRIRSRGLYIEHDGLFVSGSANWESIDPDVLFAALVQLRRAIGKPDDINGRKLK